MNRIRMSLKEETPNTIVRKIHYNFACDVKLKNDEKLHRILFEVMKNAKHTISIFKKTKSNEEVSRYFRERDKWIKEGLSNPLVPEDLKVKLRTLKIMNLKKDNEFLSELVKDLKELYDYLIDDLKMKKIEGRSLVLEYLCGWFPNNSELASIEDETFTKALNKKTGNF